MSLEYTNPTSKQKIGRLGEKLACKFLMKHGYKVIETNYLKRFGEIDIIARKGKSFHFIEVKTVSRENLDSVTHVTDEYTPESNIHYRKLQRLSRTVEAYLVENNVPHETEVHIDAVIVLLNNHKRQAKIYSIDDINL